MAPQIAAKRAGERDAGRFARRKSAIINLQWQSNQETSCRRVIRDIRHRK
jgi:hypothetical protein